MSSAPGLRDREHGWRSLLIFVASGFAGGILASALAAATVSGSVPLSVGPYAFLLFAVTLAGGVVGGWFVATLVLSRPRGGVRCPRCGTPNPRGFTVCGACGLQPS